MGLYGGLGAQDIHRRKGLKKSEQILYHMGSTELAANLLRATQAEELPSLLDKSHPSNLHRTSQTPSLIQMDRSAS